MVCDDLTCSLKAAIQGEERVRVGTLDTHVYAHAIMF